MTDRRSRMRFAPQDPCAVMLVFPTATLEGTVWNFSPNGAEILLSSEANELDPQVLSALLRADGTLQLQFQGREHRASLVWFGRARIGENEARSRLAVGVEFRESSPLSGLTAPEGAQALRISRVRHRSVGEFHVAKALRDLFLVVGEGDFSLESALALLCEKLRDLTGAEVIDFWALEDGRAILRAQAGGRCPLGRILSPEYEPVARRFPRFKKRMQNGEQLFTNDLDHSPLADHPWVRRHGIQSAMIIPVFGREMDLGVLAFSHRQNPYAFGPRQQAEAEIFASQAALFFEKASMLRNLQDSASFLAAMNRIALAFHQHLAVRELLDVICDASRELFHVDLATVLLREDSDFVQEAASGMRKRVVRLRKPKADLSELALMDQGEAFFINDFTAHPLFQMDVVRGYQSHRPARSIMVVPIRAEESVLGVLALGDLKNPERFTNRDIEKGKLLAEQAAQAIANARLYERVNQSKRIIRQQDRFCILGELAGVVSHEIKNALVPLRTLVELLPERYDDADFRNWYAKTVRQEVDRMHGLVTQLSRFRGAENRVRESISPTVFLGSVVDLVKPEAVSRQIRLELETEPELPAIEVVANEIRQVLLNLILNALQAVEEKGIVRVGVRRAQGGNGTLFWVSDTGPGIPSDKLEQIFDPLFTSKANGSGLGLAVARDLVQSHGGTIHVESTVGNGATFCVLLPEAAPLADTPGVLH